MTIDPDFREVDEPIVVISMSLSQAECFQDGMSDLLCWVRGYMSAKNGDSDYDPMGTREIRELNIALKSQIRKVRKS